MPDFEAQFLRKMLRSRKAEALEWLNAQTSKSMRNLGEMEHKPSVALVRRLYKAGAAKVLAVEISSWPEGETSSDLLVELPEDDALREQLFAVQREIAEPQGFEGDEDHGQQYLYFKLC
jgi:hypothetical protein